MGSSPPAATVSTHVSHAVLYVDDEPQNLELFRLQLGRELRVLTAKSGAEALEVLARERVAVLLTDERMPGLSGIELLAQTVERWPDVVRIIVSAYSDAARLLLAINRGHAHEYVVKPWDRAELRASIDRGLAMAERRRELAGRAERCEIYERELALERGSGPVVTQNVAFLSVLADARKAAHSDAAVLVQGETGTGKELVARFVHEASGRAHGPFVRVNCAALAEGVLESELFGHEQGAFTGAYKARRGRFELAQDGTLFLDEIGDISPKTQVSLLRVLQEKEIERVGGSAPVRVNARIVSATHRNLPRLVHEGRFREDLYYRLNVVPITVPPLRERPEDMGPLVAHLLRKHAGGRPVPGLGEGVVEQLGRYGWPGNVRELENMVQRALVLATGPELTLDDFRFDVGVREAVDPRSYSGPLSSSARDPGHTRVEAPRTNEGLTPREEACQNEREELRRLLVVHGGNFARAARATGVARTTLVSRAKKHGLLL
jgi:DNA-binding NtrC family response regulator